MNAMSVTVTITTDERDLLRQILGAEFDRRIECQFRHRRHGGLVKRALDLRVDDPADWESVQRIVIETPWRPS